MNMTTDDPVTAAILEELLRDGRKSMRQLSNAIGLSSPAVTDRVRRLEDLGIIKGYKASIDVGRIGWPVSAFVSLTAREGRCDRLLERLQSLRNIIAAHHIAGETDYLARIVARNLDELKTLTDELAQVALVSTQIVLGTSFERDPPVISANGNRERPKP